MDAAAYRHARREPDRARPLPSARPQVEVEGSVAGTGASVRLDAVICGRCGHQNRAGARFCSSCGAPLVGGRRDHAHARARSRPADARGRAGAATSTSSPRGRAARGAAGPERRQLVPARGRPAPPSAGTPTPRSSSTTSPCRAATPSSSAAATGYVVRDAGSLNGTYVEPRARRRSAAAARRRAPDRSLRPEFVLGEPRRERERRDGARAAHLSIGDVLDQLRDGVPRHHDLEDPVPREPGPHRPRAHAVGLPQVLRRPTSSGCAGSCASRASTSCR